MSTIQILSILFKRYWILNKFITNVFWDLNLESSPTFKKIFNLNIKDQHFF